MSSTNWKNSVNRPVPTTAIRLSDYLSLSIDSNLSPIDKFYERRTQIITFADYQILQDNKFLGPLLLVGLISATENFFRSIYARCIKLCSICKECSASETLWLGSAIWHADGELARGITEHLSLAEKTKIKSISKKLLNFEIRQGSQTDSALDEYEKICQLRHAVVHSSDNLPGKNAVKLSVALTSSRHHVSISEVQLQEAAQVCSSLVASFNSELFEEFVDRWHEKWVPAKETSYFTEIWEIFHSASDANTGGITNSISKTVCKNRILRDYSP